MKSQMSPAVAVVVIIIVLVLLYVAWQLLYNKKAPAPANPGMMPGMNGGGPGMPGGPGTPRTPGPGATPGVPPPPPSGK